MQHESPPDIALTEEFLRLLGHHEASLRRYIDALMPNGNDADNIAQEVRLRLWRQLGDYDRSKDFGPWARTIARYVILTYRKRQAAAPHHD